MKSSQIHEMAVIILIYSCAMAGTLAHTVVIPVLPQIGEDLDTDIIGIVEATFLAVLTCSVLIWGYHVDRISRQKVLVVSVTLYCSCCFFISIFSQSLLSYIALRLLMALGLGAIMPVTYSILGDLAAYRRRGFFSSGLDLVVITGSGLGILLGGLIGPNNWNIAFGIVGCIGLCINIPLLLLSLPLRGSSEPELQEILSPDVSKQLIYCLDLSQVRTILRKRTNLATFAQGTAALIPGVVFTYYLISLLSDSQKGGLGIGTGTATILGLSFAFGRVIGYPIFGYIGDFFSAEKKNRKAVVATVCMVIQGPLFLISFFFATMIDSGETSGQENVLFILNQPFLILFGIFFFLASFVGGGSGPNRRSLLWDVNPPEHRGSTGAIFQFTDQMGAAMGLFLGSLLLSQIDYLLVFALVSLFYFVAALFWTPAIRFANEDSEVLREQMRLRVKLYLQSSSFRG